MARGVGVETTRLQSARAHAALAARAAPHSRHARGIVAKLGTLVDRCRAVAMYRVSYIDLWLRSQII